jgi:hypothetical protein
MRLTRIFALIGLCAFLLTGLSPARAQLAVDITVGVEPPPLPVYDQPVIPAPGYLWVPGYWAWSEDIGGYYWVPGTWILPPQPDLLWTPAYWGWSDGSYVFHGGYWGPEVGFYGGVNYGFGYGGAGYEGGYWRNGGFFYNRTVNNISNVSITNVYNKTVIVNNTSHVSFNGGPNGIQAKPTPGELAAANQPHVAPTPEQTRHVEMASKDPSLSLANNHGSPAVAATPRPAELKGPGVVRAHPGPEIMPNRAPPGQAGRPGPNAGQPSTNLGADRLDKKGPPGNRPGEPNTLKPALSKPPGGNPPPQTHTAIKPPPVPHTSSPPPPRAAVRPPVTHASSPPPPPRRPPPPPPQRRPPPPPKCPPGKKC